MAMTATERENISKVLNNTKCIEHFNNLYYRWQDEKQYEDFNDYVKSMMRVMPEGATLIKGSKRPFGVTFNYGGQKIEIALKHKSGYCSLVAKIFQ